MTVRKLNPCRTSTSIVFQAPTDSGVGCVAIGLAGKDWRHHAAGFKGFAGTPATVTPAGTS
jgi:hypothetical protein